MELRSGPAGGGGQAGDQDDHLTKLAKEIVELNKEHEKIKEERERVFHYRANYLKKRPKKLVVFDAEDYFETPREALGFLERFRGRNPAMDAEVAEIVADPEWVYLNQADEKLMNELVRIFNDISERRLILGHGRPRATKGSRLVDHAQKHLHNRKMYRNVDPLYFC